MGTAALGDRPCHVLRLQVGHATAASLTYPGCPSISEVKLWIDTERGVWLKLEDWGTDTLLFKSNGVPYEIPFGAGSLQLLATHVATGYEKCPGTEAWLPRKITTQYCHDQILGALAVIDFEYTAVNSGASDADFTLVLSLDVTITPGS